VAGFAGVCIFWGDEAQVAAAVCVQSIGFLGVRASNNLVAVRVMTQNPIAEAEGMRAIMRSFDQASNVITIACMLGATNFRIREDLG